MQTRFLSDHTKPNPKLRSRVARMIDQTNFGTAANPDYGCFDASEIGPDRFVAALLGELDVLVACCVVQPQKSFVPRDSSRSDYISGFCVDPAVRRMGLGMKLQEHLCAQARERHPRAEHHHFWLDAVRHNWPFWVVKMGYICIPSDDAQQDTTSFMRRTW